MKSKFLQIRQIVACLLFVFLFFQFKSAPEITDEMLYQAKSGNGKYEKDGLNWPFLHAELKNLKNGRKTGMNGQENEPIRAEDNSTKYVRSNTALNYAAILGDPDIILVLLSNGADTEIKNRHGYTPLHNAVEHDKKEAVKLLLEAGADVHARNNDRKNALERSIRNGNRAIVELLLNNGANKYPKQNWNALHLAVKKRNIEIAELLLEREFDVNRKEIAALEETPLHLAALEGDVGMTKLLIIYGANIKAKNNTGETPLHHAARNGHKTSKTGLISNKSAKESYEGVAKLLIFYKADVNAKDNKGTTPLQIAESCEAHEIVKLMLAKQANTEKKEESVKAPISKAKSTR